MADGADGAIADGAGGGVVAVVLGGGSGSRFVASGGQGHKLLSGFRGRPLVDWAIDAAMTAAIGPVWLVTGATTPPVPAGVETVPNPRWSEGMATSLQAAVARARTVGCDAIVVGLADQPLVTADAWRLVAAAGATPIARACYDGVPGHPVRLAAAIWDELPLSGDEGARRIIKVRPDLVRDVACPGNPADVDTWEDTQRWS